MPGGTTEVGGNTKLQTILAFTVTTPSVNANTSTTATFTVPGLLVYDLVDPQAQTHVAGLSIASGWCAANNTLTLQFVNSTTGTIGAQSNYQILLGVTRYENANLGLSAFPAAIV